MTGATVYLDLANWIELAEERLHRSPFEAAVAEGRVVPVLCVAHLIEMGQIQAGRPRHAVAAYVDEVIGIGDVRWIRGDAVRREAVACFRELVNGTFEPPQLFTDTYLETLPDPSVRYLVDGTTPRTVIQLVETVRAIDDFREDFRRYRLHYPKLRELVAASRRGSRRRFSEQDLRVWLSEELPDRIRMQTGNVYPIDLGMRRWFAEKVNLDQCRAFRATSAFHEGWNLNPRGASETDVPDAFHLDGVAYCDLAFVDKRTREALRQGRYDPLPQPNSAFQRWAEAL